jgi:hypothetical protein
VIGLLAIVLASAVAVPAAAYGANWTIEPTPGPTEYAESALSGLSCVSTAACMAVGSDDMGRAAPNSFELVNPGSFSERWDGTAWTVVPTPASAGANAALYAISCATASFCVAVGQTHSLGRTGFRASFAYGPQRALIEVWNGAAWTVQPNPGAKVAASGLFGVSCPSASMCMAVGTHAIGTHSVGPVVELWNGTSWRVVNAPAASRTGTVTVAVSCASTSECMLVGWYNANQGTGITIGAPLAERWSGGQWSVQHPPGRQLYGPDLRAISCTSQSFCMATGVYALGNGSVVQSPFADRWNGSAWAATGGLPKYGPLFGVSCVSRRYCVAVGQFDPALQPPSSATDALAEAWSGASWTRVALPPFTAPNFGPYEWDQLDPALVGVSCLAQVGCTAVGAHAVANNSTATAAVQPGAPAALPEPPPPAFDRSADVQLVSGTVSIELPGTHAFVPLSSLSSVPVGTVIDTTNGTVELTSAADNRGETQTGQFYSGIFKFTQTKARSQLRGGRQVGVTVLTLSGGLPTGCGASGARAQAATTRTARRLWGNARGNFRTQGRYASATVRGTNWLTEDTCAGTLIKVARGVVSVDDLAHHRTVLVRAPHSFLAHPGPGG